MWFVAIGVLMLLMNFAGIGPIGEWTWGSKWWAFLLPFVCAIVWWTIADNTGYYQRKAQEKMDQKVRDRRAKNLAALGMDARKKKR